MPTYTWKAKVWEYPGDAAWHFVSLPKKYTPELKVVGSGIGSQFGSIKVTAKINDYSWQTSLFPDNASGAYVLPLKKEVRRMCALKAGKNTTVCVTLL